MKFIFKNLVLPKYLSEIANFYSDKKFLYTDPIHFVYRFFDSKEKEFIGLLIALFSYGNVKAMFQFLESLLVYLSPNPLEKIRQFNFYSIDLFYRFQSKKDIHIIFEVFKEIVVEQERKSYLFFDLFNFDYQDINIYRYIDSFQESILKRIPKIFLTNGIKHYFTFSKKSVAKRYCLFFRWMVRDTFPDFGIYSFIDKRNLIYPLDTHIIKFAYENTIITKPYANRKNAILITNFFKAFKPSDPLYFDFYLTRDQMLQKIKK